MRILGLVGSNRLTHWADSYNAKAEFPRLVRHLILETSPNDVRLSFRADDGITYSGWDGWVLSTEQTRFIPSCLSLWELSTEKNISSKATTDYEKRVSTPDGSDTQGCIYIAVTLRRWKDKDDWAKNRRSECKWKDVRAYDVDDILRTIQLAERDRGK